MKIIISPSKTQNIDNMIEQNHSLSNDCLLTKNLFSLLKQETKESLQKLMKINKSLLDDTYSNYQEFSLKNHQKQAIELYTGVVFEQIKTHTYNDKQKIYMNNYLVILSAMYGAISPDSYIWPYRLDMTMKPSKINLYAYWEDWINDYFKDEEIIINLASNEFSRMLKGYKGKLINISFKERSQKGQLKIVSYNAKKARGLMVDYFIKNEIYNPEQIKAIEIEGYQFNHQLSTESDYVFIKNT